MTKEEILTKAIEKARKDGFNSDELVAYFPREVAEKGNEFMITALANSPDSIIFSHNFARAFWGDIWPEEFVGVKGLRGNFPYWQAELQQMVVEEDRLKYIEKFL